MYPLKKTKKKTERKAVTEKPSREPRGESGGEKQSVRRERGSKGQKSRCLCPAGPCNADQDHSRSR